MISSCYDAVIFDFDGVIVESTDIKTEAFRNLFSDFPEHADSIIALHLRNEGVDRYRKLEMIYREILQITLLDKKKHELAKKFSDEVVDQVIAAPMVNGAADVLSSLFGRSFMAVVSGTPQNELETILNRRGLKKYFCAICGTPPDKSKTVAKLLLEKGWLDARVLLIGDAMTDYVAARENDLVFVGRVAPGKINPFPSETHVINDLTDLRRLIKYNRLSGFI